MAVLVVVHLVIFLHIYIIIYIIVLDGLLNEMGPYIVNSDGKTLHYNPNSWNKVKNSFFIYLLFKF